MRIDVPPVVIKVADRVVLCGTQKTASGNYIIDYEDLSDLISESVYAECFDLIADEVESREEVLDLWRDKKSGTLNCNFGLAYCPNYEWYRGDESIFGSYEAWEQMKALPVAQRYLP